MPVSPLSPPDVNVGARRAGTLPEAHESVFDLKPGEVSQVFSDPGSLYIYKLVSIRQVPLSEVKATISSTLQRQMITDKIQQIQKLGDRRPQRSVLWTREAADGPSNDHHAKRDLGSQAEFRIGSAESECAASSAAEFGGASKIVMPPERTVLVTGISGNLGTRLLPLLSDFHVVGVDTRPPDSSGSGEVRADRPGSRALLLAAY